MEISMQFKKNKLLCHIRYICRLQEDIYALSLVTTGPFLKLYPYYTSENYFLLEWNHYFVYFIRKVNDFLCATKIHKCELLQNAFNSAYRAEL